MAQDGLAVPKVDWLWPQVQARITVQTAALSPLSTISLGRDGAPGQARGVQSGAVFGDYTFARPSFGNFRASGGLLLGQLGGAPLLSAGAGGRLGISVLEGGTLAMAGADAATVPYVGLGYSSPAFWSGFSLTADLGLVAGRASGIAGFGRAMLGNQAMDAALRDMRLAPVLQLGLRYEF